MSQTSVEVTASRWIVEASCPGESPEQWEFGDALQAQWFAALARELWNSRCPKCGNKDVVGLQLWRNNNAELVAIASCGAWDDDRLDLCSFREKFHYPGTAS